MTSNQAKAFRKRLDKKILNAILPEGMSAYEYKLHCDVEGFSPSVENGMFLHFLITAKPDYDEQEKIVHNAIIGALSKKYLLDPTDDEQCSYFCDAIRDVLLRDKWFAEKLLETVLLNYKDENNKTLASVFDFCKTLNKAFGLTSVEYFCMNPSKIK